MNYYNEHDPQASAWIEELVASADLPPGLVDSRDVQAVGPGDLLHQYDQCHFFAGIGGWPHALDLAGWPRDKPIWTASLPCQPWSDAGKQLGVDDERHLWPAFRDLVAHYRPQYLVGEQVASKAGRAWLADVQVDLEALGYRSGATDICAASIGAPHIRQRLFWCAVRVGIPDGEGWLPRIEAAEDTGHRDTVGPDGGDGRNPWGNVVYVRCSDGKARPLKSRTQQMVDEFPGVVVHGCDQSAPSDGGREESKAQAPVAGWPTPMAGTPAQKGYNEAGNTDSSRRTCALVAGWPTPNTTEGGQTSRSGDRKGELLVGGIARGIDTVPAETAIPPLVYGPSDDADNTDEARTMRLRGYGNAIVVDLAAEFVRAFMDILQDLQA